MNPTVNQVHFLCLRSLWDYINTHVSKTKNCKTSSDLVKLRNNPGMKWNNKYLISAFAGLILSGILSYIIFLQTNLQVGFGTGFLLGFTLHSLSRETRKLFGY